jgi:hemerythrin-like domain-containing protein
MMPIGPLMIEHRLIERMIKQMQIEVDRMRRDGTMDIVFIDSCIDFIRTYADRLHHGKEEILFHELEKREMTAELKAMMQGLIEDHVYARHQVAKLVSVRSAYHEGDKSAVSEAVEIMASLTSLYPIHIAKEDKEFFLPAMDYFTEEEKEAMLVEFYDFDRKLIHDHYKGVVEKLETLSGTGKQIVARK